MTPNQMAEPPTTSIASDQTGLLPWLDRRSGNFLGRRRRKDDAKAAEVGELATTTDFQAHQELRHDIVAVYERNAIQRRRSAAWHGAWVKLVSNRSAIEDMSIQRLALKALASMARHHDADGCAALFIALNEHLPDRGPERAGLEKWLDALGDKSPWSYQIIHPVRAMRKEMVATETVVEIIRLGGSNIRGVAFLTESLLEQYPLQIGWAEQPKLVSALLESSASTALSVKLETVLGRWFANNDKRALQLVPKCFQANLESQLIAAGIVRLFSKHPGEPAGVGAVVSLVNSGATRLPLIEQGVSKWLAGSGSMGFQVINGISSTKVLHENASIRGAVAEVLRHEDNLFLGMEAVTKLFESGVAAAPQIEEGVGVWLSHGGSSALEVLGNMKRFDSVVQSEPIQRGIGKLLRCESYTDADTRAVANLIDSGVAHLPAIANGVGAWFAKAGSRGFELIGRLDHVGFLARSEPALRGVSKLLSGNVRSTAGTDAVVKLFDSGIAGEPHLESGVRIWLAFAGPKALTALSRVQNWDPVRTSAQLQVGVKGVIEARRTSPVAREIASVLVNDPVLGSCEAFQQLVRSWSKTPDPRSFTGNLGL